MLLDNQNQFRELYIKALRRGQEVDLPRIYGDLHKLWAEDNKAMLYKLSDDEYLQAFTDFLEEEVDGRVKDLISTLDDAEELRRLATRGQVLLASKDGENFDTLITPDRINEAQATEYILLSPSLRTSTTNLREVMDEQSLLHVVKKLKDQNFAVQSATMEDHIVKIELVPRGGKTNVEIDLSGEATQTLIYEFIDAEGGRKAVPESQLPEAFGTAVAAEELQELSEEEQLIDTTMSEIGSHGLANAMTNVNATKTTADLVNAVNIANAANAAAAAAALGEGMNAPALSGLGQVMAAKARMHRQKEEQGKRAERIEQRVERQKNKQTQEETRAKAETEATEERERVKQKNRKNLMRSGAAIAGIGGALTSVAVGTTLFTIFF